MRIIVSGATGFLGGAVVRTLRARGCEVVALGRDKTRLAALEATGVRAMRMDLARDEALPLLEADAFVHCAALSAPWGARIAFHAANVRGTERAVDLARRAGAKRFVHISTPSLYFRFQDQIGVREDMPLPRPVNDYVATKRAAEKIVSAAEDLDPIILRPRGLYGPGDTTLLPRLIAAASTRALPLMNGGRAATDLTYIDDVADAVCAALFAEPQLRQRVFNISGGVALNVKHVAERVAERAYVPLRWRELPAPLVIAFARASETMCSLTPGRPEPPVTAYGAALFAFTQTLNIDAARAHLNWSPHVSFDEGLDRTFASAPESVAA